jgi:integrase
MDRHIRDHTPSWTDPRAAAIWRASLEQHAAGLMLIPVDQIDVADVEACVGRIWLAKAETASRVRGRIERILGACIARDERQGPNPAALKDNLDHILPRRRAVQVEHHAAVPLDEAQDAFAAIWERREVGMGTAALVVVALTALRSGEVRGLQWPDICADTITIPADRMKARRIHRVPVTPVLGDWLGRQPRLAGAQVFFGARSGRPLSDMALSMAMRRAGLGDYTPHGWRSVFRDWAAREAWDSDLAEDQLAHVVGNAVARAYRRADFLERRRPMMESWESWITAHVRR